MSTNAGYDMAFIGHFTRDTIVRPGFTTIQQGGAINFGCHVAAAMGLSAVVVTRLAREDFSVVDRMRSLGVNVLAQTTPHSTCLKLVYPGDNPDDRTIYVESTAGAFAPDEVAPLHARAYLVGASMRGEVPLDVIKELAAKGGTLSADLQGYVRVNQHGTLVTQPWPEATAFLHLVDIVKADIVEAAFLTGESDVEAAARALVALGPREAVITSRDGVGVLANGRFYSAPWRGRSLAGRSGRGDTCIAAYVAKRLTRSPQEATRWAAALTSLKLQTPGPFQGEIAHVEALIKTRYA